jgi:hypothetical protein
VAGTARRLLIMRYVSLFLSTVAAAVALAAQTQAEPSNAATCADVLWKNPGIAKSCVAVVERNGKRYIKMSGKVTKKGKDSITVLLDNSKEELTWAPDLGETVSIDGKETSPMNVAVGQSLRFYVPEAHVATK